MWAHGGGESGAGPLAAPAAGGELFPGVPVQHAGLAAGRGQDAAPARRWRRHRPLLPAAGHQSVLLLIQVRRTFSLSVHFYPWVSNTCQKRSLTLIVDADTFYCLYSCIWSSIRYTLFSMEFWNVEQVSLVVCPIFLLSFTHLRPPEIDNQMVNKTVRACCEGWGGPRCSEGELFPRLGIPLKYSCSLALLVAPVSLLFAFSQELAHVASVSPRGAARSSLVFTTPPWCPWSSAVAACGDLAGGMPLTAAAYPAPTRCFQVRQHACMYVHRHTNTKTRSFYDYCSVIYLLPADSQSSPMVRGGLLGSVRAPQSSATCLSWGGAHYRTFDRKHFHFQGSCTYLLASSTDGTWAVYISTVCSGGGECSKVCPSPVTRH